MIEYVDCAWRNPLEQTGDNTAKEMTDCNYPCCEECEHFTSQTCDIPIVLSKENWHILTEKIARLEKLTEEIEKSLYDEILGANKGYGLPDNTEIVK